MEQLILASNSPRRKEILTQAGVLFTIKTQDTDETCNEQDPKEYVKQLSFRKAEAVFSKTQGPVTVIGADTVVALEGKILLKPKDEADAKQMLKSLSNKVHEVCTGVTVIKRTEDLKIKKETFCEGAKVTVTDLTDEEISAYIATKEPMDKAGSYAIQGRFARYISNIEGDYYAIVGLPICHLMQVLKNI